MPRARAASSSPAGQHVLAPLAHHDGGAGVLAHRAARRRRRCRRSSGGRARRSGRWPTPRGRRGWRGAAAGGRPGAGGRCPTSPRGPGGSGPRARPAGSGGRPPRRSTRPRWSAAGTRCRRARAGAAAGRRSRSPSDRSARSPDRRQSGGMAPTTSADGFRIEHDSMGEVRVPADARWGAQTQRAVENFPISGRTDRPGADRRARVDQGGRPRRSTAGCKVIPKDMAAAIHDAAAEVATGDWDDQFPIDVFQTGSGTSSNMNVNEVIASLASERLGAPGPPERPRQRVAVVQRRVPVGHPPRRRPVDRRHAAARARAPRGRAAAGRAAVPDGREVGPHPPDGRHAGDPRPGVRRLRRADRARASSASATRCPGSAGCRSAAPRSAPASTPRRPSPATSSSGWPRTWACRWSRRPTTSPRRAPATRWSRCPGSCGRSRCRSPRSPTTSAGWARGPAPVWPRSASPTCSPARRSCPAR